MERKIWEWAQEQGEERVPLEEWDEEYILKTAAKMAVVGSYPENVLSEVVENIYRRPKQIGTSIQDWDELRDWLNKNKPSSLIEKPQDPRFWKVDPRITLVSEKDGVEIDVYRFATSLFFFNENFKISSREITVDDTNTEDLERIILKIYEQREALKKAYQEVEVQVGKYKMLSKIQRKVIPKVAKEFKGLRFSKIIRDSDFPGRPGCMLTISPDRTFYGKLFVIIPYGASVEQIRQIFRETEKELEIISNLKHLHGDFITPIKYVAAKTKERKKGHGSRQDQGKSQDRSQGTIVGPRKNNRRSHKLYIRSGS